MMRKVWFGLSGFLFFGGLVLGQGLPQQQQRPRPDNFGIRGKVIIGTGREGDMHIEVRLEKTCACHHISEQAKGCCQESRWA